MLDGYYVMLAVCAACDHRGWPRPKAGHADHLVGMVLGRGGRELANPPSTRCLEGRFTQRVNLLLS